MAGAAVGILRMPTGNLQSVWNALYELGSEPVFLDAEADYSAIERLVIPGVGHFRTLMQDLQARSIPQKVRAFAATGRPVLGICAGFQVLARSGTEGGETPGIGLLAGRVDSLPRRADLRLPHVGWSTVRIRRPHPVFEGLKSDRDFYFVHSYAMRVEDEQDWLGETVYGEPFVSVAGRANVVGTQFHPEKSQVSGLKLLENFAHWDGRC